MGFSKFVVCVKTDTSRVYYQGPNDSDGRFFGFMKNTSEDTSIEPVIYDRSEHSVSRKHIDPDALKIMRRLVRNGYKGHLVGGGVRDLLLGKTPKDFDIATDATPRRIKSLFRNCRIIGRRFKLAHIYFGSGKIIEVSTFRDAHETPTEENGDSEDLFIQRDNVYGDECSDALRRDITINALFYSLDGFSVIDYVGGMEDLRNGIVRVIGDPFVRFAEDPVRMIRTVRHACRAEFIIEEACRTAILNHNNLLSVIPKMRLYEEVKKDLLSGSAASILKSLAEHNILQHLIPELSSADSQLLNVNSYLQKILTNSDKIIKEDHIISPTAILAVLTLFMNSNCHDLEELVSNFHSIDALVKHVSASFCSLMVPKKERDKIQKILITWYKLELDKISYGELGQLASSYYFNDLLHFLKFFNLHGEKGDIIREMTRIKRRSPAEIRKRGRNRSKYKKKNYNKHPSLKGRR